MRAPLLAAGFLAISCLAVSAAPRVTVTESVTLDVPPAKVWARIGNFADLTWVPAVKSSDASDDNRKGSVRRLNLGGPILWEKLLAHNNKKMTYEYHILDNGTNQKILPVSHYISTIKVEASGKGSKATWSSHFEPAGKATGQAAKKAVAGIYRAGLDNLTKVLAGN